MIKDSPLPLLKGSGDFFKGMGISFATAMFFKVLETGQVSTAKWPSL